MLCLLAERHEPFLAALAEHAQYALAQVDLIGAQADELAHAQARGVEQLEHRAVAQAERRVDIGRADQRLDLRFGQRLRQRPRQLRRVEQQGRISIDRAEPLLHAEEVPQRRQQARVAARAVAAAQAFTEVVVQVRTRRARETHACMRAPAREALEVAPVACERVFGEAAFGPCTLEEIIDRAAVAAVQFVGRHVRLFALLLHRCSTARLDRGCKHKPKL